MPSQLDRIEWKLDVLLAELRGGRVGLPDLPIEVVRPPVVDPKTVRKEGVKGRDRVVMDALQAMTMKQHATVQMVLRGASNQEIADRFGVSVNTAKVYLRSIAKKLGVTLRTQIAVRLLPVINDMDEEEYLELSKGLPKDWDETYDYEHREDDPYWRLYTGSRVGLNGGDDEEEGDE